MLANGAHGQLGPYSFLLDEDIDSSQLNSGFFRPHYTHTAESLFATADTAIIGMAKKENVHPERLIWSVFDDWSGGEGNRLYSEDNPFTYDYADGLNPRIRGELTGRPSRSYVGSTLATNDVSKRPTTAVGSQAFWYGGGQRIGYIGTNVSPAGANWQIVDSTNTGTTDLTGLQHLSGTYAITAMCGDSEYMYYSAQSVSGTTGSRVLLAKTSDNTNAAGPVTGTSTAVGIAPFAGMSIMNGRLYGWTGRKLFEHDISNLTGATVTALASTACRKVFDSGVDPATNNVFGNQYWAGTAASENQVFMFYTTHGQSQVFQFHNSKGAGPLWTCPQGFSVKQITYQNGILWCAGHWGGSSNSTGFGALYALPLDTLKPVFVNWFRRSQAHGLNLQMQEMSSSYGNQIMVAAARTGRVFIYDADMDAVSMLDSISTAGDDGEGSAGSTGSPFTSGTGPNGSSGDGGLPTDALSFTMNSDRIGQLATWGLWRFVFIFDPSQAVGTAGNYRLLYYSDDEKWNVQTSTATNDTQGGLDSGDWDFRLPFEQKALMGFDVSYEPLTTGQELEVWYKLDQGSWALAAMLTSASADAAKGRTYIQVSASDGPTFPGGQTDPPTTTVKFTSMRVKTILRGKRIAGVDHAPPVCLAVNAEAQLITFDHVWEIAIQLKDEKGGTRLKDRAVPGEKLRQWVWNMVKDKSIVTFLDGYPYKQTGKYDTWSCTIENPQDVIKRNAEGTLRLTLRTVPS